jgi:anaphase-promoting complex subunit 1
MHQEFSIYFCTQKSDSVVGLSDLKIADTLFSYMTAGQLKRPIKARKKEAIHSYRILETGAVNTHVTAPGAILALGLIYMKSNNRAITQWLETPDSNFALQSIRPDFLTLQTISRGLILFDDVHPSEQWVDSQIPQNIKSLALQSGQGDAKSDISIVDNKLINQAMVHITAGACMAIGLKFAGSSNQCAFDCLVKYCKDFIALLTPCPFSRQVNLAAGKYPIQYCLQCCLLALSMVMAGTGNVIVLRLIRQLHGRLDGKEINYGTHMAVHMALGFLFLGGARYSLKGDDRSIPSLLCSVFPMFPRKTTDNRYHLQALRHLYVLACEPRLLIPRDVHTMELCYVPAEIDLRNGKESITISVLLPYLLPHLSSVKEVRISGDRYWPIRIQIEGNEEHTRALLGIGGTLFVQKRQGCLTYQEDPKGHLALLSHCVTGQEFLDTQASCSLGMALSTLSVKLGNLTADHLPPGSQSVPHVIPISRPKDGSKQIQLGKEVELVLRFYSSVPGIDYKRACKDNLLSCLLGTIATGLL